MTVIAYLYIDPLLESTETEYDWQQNTDRIYTDLGSRSKFNKIAIECRNKPPESLLLRQLEDLGDTVSEICDRLNLLESFGIDVIADKQNYQSSVWQQYDIKDFKAYLSQIIVQIGKNRQVNRIKQGHARNRLKTLPPPGKAPYGYRRGKDRYIIDKSTAPVVKDFFERFLLFGSLRGAVKYLEQRYGKKIAPSTGKKWLSNPVYRGDLQYNNGDVVSDTHTAIIDRESAAQIDRLLRRNSNLAPRTASASRSLAGLVVCQQCQLTMNVSRVTQRYKKQEYLYLRSPNCPCKPKCKAINYQAFLEKTVSKICRDLPSAVAKSQQPNFKAICANLQQNIASKKEVLSQLETLVTQNILDRETASLRSYKLKTEIAQLQNRIDSLPPTNLKAIASTVSLPQFWFDLSEAERRFYFREFIRQIEVIRLEDGTWDLKLIFIFI